MAWWVEVLGVLVHEELGEDLYIIDKFPKEPPRLRGTVTWWRKPSLQSITWGDPKGLAKGFSAIRAFPFAVAKPQVPLSTRKSNICLINTPPFTKPPFGSSRITGRISLGERELLMVSFFARRVSPHRRLVQASCSGQKGGGHYTLACDRPFCGTSPVKDKRACKDVGNIEQLPNHRHRNLKAFEEQVQKHVSSHFVTE